MTDCARQEEQPEPNWWVYMIRCDDDSLYTGVSTDPECRFQEHLQHPRGAKYFNGRLPVAIVYSESGHSRSTACQREAAIKKLDRLQKLCLISDHDAANSG
jgi:putative endonuclease